MWLISFFRMLRYGGVTLLSLRMMITGVPRTRTVVAGDELFSHGEFLLHLPRRWIHGRQGACLLRSTARLHRRLRLLQRGLLAGVNEQLRVFHGRVLQNSVAKVQNVSVTG
jgi:hypothetical protein